MGGYNLTYSPALWQAKFYLLQQASRLPHYFVYSGAEVDEGARVDEGGKVDEPQDPSSTLAPLFI